VGKKSRKPQVRVPEPPQPAFRGWPVWRAALGAVVAAVVLGFALLQGRSSAGPVAVPALPLGSLAALGPLAVPGNLGALGPEGVPVPAAPALAAAGSLAPGQSVDGVSCKPVEQLAFHIHAHLAVFVDGEPRRVPYGIGIGSPVQVEDTPAGPFAAGGACFSWLHTHASDGIIHIESPVQHVYTLGDFFDVWGQQLGQTVVASALGRVTAFVDGRPYKGNPRSIPLFGHAEIQLDVGRPLVAPESVRFPKGM
jgi:hypothetical protein